MQLFRHRSPYWLLVSLTAALLFWLANAAAAQTYPSQIDPYVSDYAGVMTPADVSYVQQRFSDLQLNADVEATVLTIDSLQTYTAAETTIETFATGLFNTWGIGDARTNNGILLLVSVDDRRVRIEVGAGYGTSLNGAMQTIIDQTMIPRFKADDYSGGIRQGADAIVERLSGEGLSVEGLSGDGGSLPASRTAERLPLVGGGLAGLGLVGYAARAYLRHRPRRCPDCGSPMARLDEAADDRFLDQPQQLEEQLGSVDYDVWHCQSCARQVTYHYKNPLSRFSRCRRCRFRTMRKKRKTTRAATYAAPGKARVTENCQHCGHQHVYTTTIPRKRRRKRGGGGRSSGGGASGSW